MKRDSPLAKWRKATNHTRRQIAELKQLALEEGDRRREAALLELDNELAICNSSHAGEARPKRRPKQEK